MWSPTANRSRLQLGLIVAAAAVLVVVLLDRAERLAAEAERMSVEMQIEALNRLATLRYATLLARGGPQRLTELEGANPMLWDALVSPEPLAGGAGEATTGPVGYVGERSVASEGDLERGSWAYDAGRGLLLYRYRFAPEDPVGDDSSALVAYRAQLIFDDSDADGQFDAGEERVAGAKVARVEPR
jgi:hypothetical protein